MSLKALLDGLVADGKLLHSALKDAYESCILVESMLGNIISDPDENIPCQGDIDKYNQAKRFIDFYEKYFC
jgi:hypothetical protein